VKRLALDAGTVAAIAEQATKGRCAPAVLQPGRVDIRPPAGVDDNVRALLDLADLLDPVAQILPHGAIDLFLAPVLLLVDGKADPIPGTPLQRQDIALCKRGVVGDGNGQGDFRMRDGLGVALTVSAGFETNLASVPRALWAIFPPYGFHLRVAIVHYYLYARRTIVDRGRVDSIFLAIMLRYGVRTRRARAMYLAVRLFGAGAWGR
jgi:uncharacterized protein DUF1353